MLPALAFLATRALAQTSALPPPVVEPARAAAARLGSALGRSVEVARELGRVPVLVDAPGLAPETALRALALALRASLVADGKALRIERTVADRKAVGAAHFAANRDRVVDGLARWSRILKRADRLGDAATQVRAARAEVSQVGQAINAAATAHQDYVVPSELMGESMVTPVARLLHGLLVRLGPDRLAALAPGEQAFFSDRPNAAESPLPADGDLVASYAAAQEGYAAAMGLPAPAGPPVKVVLRVNEAFVNVALYDARGRCLDRTAMSYRVEVFYRAEPTTTAAPAPWWVERDAASRRMTAVVAATYEPLRPEKLPEAVLHPERSDPLGFDVRTGLLAISRPPDAPAFVAALSDGLLPLAGESVQVARLDAAAFAWRLRSEQGGYETLDRDGVTLVRPRDALAAEAGLADREALGREIRRVVAARDYGMRSRCLYDAALYSVPTGFTLDAGYNWALNRTFGPITNDPPAGAMALAGFALAAGTVEADADAPPFAELVRDGIVKGWLRFEGPPGASDLDGAPSSVLAALDGARVACAATETPVVERYANVGAAEMAKVRFGGKDPEAVGADAVWMFAYGPLAKQEKWRARYTQSATKDDVRYLLGRERTNSIEVRLRNGLHARLDFKIQLEDRRNLAFDELPPEIQAAILRGAKAMFDNPPPSTGGMVLPTPGTAAKP